MSYTFQDTAAPLTGRGATTLSKGTIVKHDGDTCHVVVEGALVSCQSLTDGKSQIVGYHLPGDTCGLSSIGTGLRNYHIRALVPSVAVPIPAALLTNLASRSLALAHALFHHMSVEAAISRQWVTSLGQRSAFLRIGHLACELERRLDAIGLADAGSFNWFGTQRDLGAATGLSLVHVNKSLRRLREEGLVDWSKTVRILDLDRLRSVVGFDPSYLCLAEQKLGHLLLEIDAWDASAQRGVSAQPLRQSVLGAANGQGSSRQQ